ncbi:MAG TPA: GatB/YqeY domain-containing protein [Candidatus Woesebacteria bacterium]|nr:GatB/YqeY domain-containing protein [Candidatus Woesebacteria bacterium]
MLYSQIKLESQTAQKAGDSRLYNALKLLVSELSYAQVDYKEGELPDEEVVRVLNKEGKKRKDSIEIYEKAGASDRADQEKYELSVIEKYLPQLMSEADVEAEIVKIAAETGLTGGRLMGAVMGKLRGKADGGMINKIVMVKFP